MGAEHHNDAWQTLVTTALLGTGRGDSSVPFLNGPVATLLDRVPAESAEQRLLTAAGVLSLYGRAGWRPAAQSRSPLPCTSEDDAPACSARAASQLRRVLELELDDVLRDWCRAAAKAGVRAPDELLPALLNLIPAREHSELGEVIAAILGARGRWLASLNPAWSVSLSPEENWETCWQTGSQSERLAALRRLRRRDPARTRELVDSTWSQEEPDSRVAILQVVRSNLAAEDETLLETALDDKRKNVRAIAAELLAQLPDSQYCRRIGEQTRPFVQIEKKRGLFGSRKLTLAASVPPEDLKLSREGLEAKAHGDMGPRAWMLVQMLAATPLAIWTDAAAAKPEEILAAARGSEWKTELTLGWMQAAARQRNPAWAEPLLRGYVETSDPAELQRLTPFIGRLMACLDSPVREVLAGEFLRDHANARLSGPGWEILEACEHDWSQPFSECVLEFLLARLSAHVDGYEPPLGRELPVWVAVHLHLGLVGATVKKWSQRIPDWQPARQRFADELLGLLQFRREYLKELLP